MVDSSPPSELNIQLGDILEFNAPEDEKLDKQNFLVNYIDNNILKIINLENEELITINITDKQLDAQINSIELISRADFPGFAKQYDLLPETWIDLYFETPEGVPFIITGKITSLEEDSISIETFPDKEIIYIDFKYQGIPENLPLEKIVIRKEPIQKGLTPNESKQFSIPQDEQDIIFPEGIPTQDIQAQLQEDLLEGNIIQLGEDLDEFSIFIDVPESEKRYSIEKQTDDLLDELLSEIPSYKRTNSILNNIHTMIERFVQLRSLYSDFDSNGNANLPKHINNNVKPIIKSLANFEKHYDWLLPVSYNRKKIYDLDEILASELDVETVDLLLLSQSLVSEDNEIEKYRKGGFPSDENKYLYLFKSLNRYMTPFEQPLTPEQSITSQRVNNNILSVIDILVI